MTPHPTRQQSRASYAPGTKFAFGRIIAVRNTDTDLGTRFHRQDGTDLAGLNPASGRPRLLPAVGVEIADRLPVYRRAGQVLESSEGENQLVVRIGAVVGEPQTRLTGMTVPTIGMSRPAAV